MTSRADLSQITSSNKKYPLHKISDINQTPKQKQLGSHSCGGF